MQCSFPYSKSLVSLFVFASGFAIVFACMQGGSQNTCAHTSSPLYLQNLEIEYQGIQWIAVSNSYELIRI